MREQTASLQRYILHVHVLCIALTCTCTGATEAVLSWGVAKTCLDDSLFSDFYSVLMLLPLHAPCMGRGLGTV